MKVAIVLDRIEEDSISLSKCLSSFGVETVFFAKESQIELPPEFTAFFPFQKKSGILDSVQFLSHFLQSQYDIVHILWKSPHDLKWISFVLGSLPLHTKLVLSFLKKPDAWTSLWLLRLLSKLRISLTVPQMEDIRWLRSKGLSSKILVSILPSHEYLQYSYRQLENSDDTRPWIFQGDFRGVPRFFQNKPLEFLGSSDELSEMMKRATRAYAVVLPNPEAVNLARWIFWSKSCQIPLVIFNKHKYLVPDHALDHVLIFSELQGTLSTIPDNSFKSTYEDYFGNSISRLYVQLSQS